MLRSQRLLYRTGALLLLLALVAGLGYSAGNAPQRQPSPSAAVEAPMLSSVGGAPALQSSAVDTSPAFVTGQAAHFDVSPPLRDIPAVRHTGLRTVTSPDDAARVVRGLGDPATVEDLVRRTAALVRAMSREAHRAALLDVYGRWAGQRVRGTA